MDKGRKIAIIGPGHPLRGGLTTFNQRLAREFIAQGDTCVIYSFSLQYPGFLFPGTSQYTDEPAPEGLTIHTIINSVNPLNWLKVGKRIAMDRPDIILVRYWIPFMGPALGTILRLVRANKHTRIIGLADNIIPHEKRPGDSMFTKYFIGSCHAFITMSEKVMADLRSLEKVKPARLVAHPLYDNFGEAVPKDVARQRLGLELGDKIILFFGFIRKYKGLDILLEAMADPRIRQTGIKLLVAGEFYEDEKEYQEQIERLGIRDLLILRTQFISDREVVHYFCAADVVVQPYRNATQSGVTPLAYHFEKPMVVTNVGGLPSMVPDRRCGLVAEVDPKAIATAILEFYQLGEAFFIPHLRSEKLKLSWSQLTDTIKSLASTT
ncbi:MAG: glycosyltransferase [Saprospiraceae bacterium]|nr:glycosyltransferase [Candidatus Opimibacter iunctus]